MKIFKLFPLACAALMMSACSRTMLVMKAAIRVLLAIRSIWR